jgi:AraC family transcriptional regulator
MTTKTIYIKNMCCQRCIEAVQVELVSFQLKIVEIKLGEATFVEHSNLEMNVIANALHNRGFELIISEETRLVEAVKTNLIELIHQSKLYQDYKIHLPEFIEEKLKKPYRYIHKLFLEHTKLTIEKYTILQRIEKVKALIEEENNLNFSEIGHLAGYKTQQHLSSQFKKITGMSMYDYKNSKNKNRKPINEI